MVSICLLTTVWNQYWSPLYRVLNWRHTEDWNCLKTRSLKSRISRYGPRSDINYYLCLSLNIHHDYPMLKLFTVKMSWGFRLEGWTTAISGLSGIHSSSLPWLSFGRITPPPLPPLPPRPPPHSIPSLLISLVWGCPHFWSPGRNIWPSITVNITTHLNSGDLFKDEYEVQIHQVRHNPRILYSRLGNELFHQRWDAFRSCWQPSCHHEEGPEPAWEWILCNNISAQRREREDQCPELVSTQSQPLYTIGFDI